MNPMQMTVSQTADFLKEIDNILILTHRYPDGDTIGSASALCRALRDIGKNCVVRCGDMVPEKYNYMLCEDIADFKWEHIIAVDVADNKLLGENFCALYGDKVELCIDHHGSNTGYAERLCLDASAAAAGEVVYRVILSLCGKINDKATAECLYTAIATDTGCFKFGNTTADTHIIAAELMKMGIDAEKINRVMFETRSRERIALEGALTSSIEYCFDGRCAIMCMTDDILKKFGASESDLDGLSAIPRTISGVQAGVTVRSAGENRYKVSLRTLPQVKASEICKAFGGGGHPAAAGCTVEGSLDEVKRKLKEEIANHLI